MLNDINLEKAILSIIAVSSIIFLILSIFIGIIFLSYRRRQYLNLQEKLTLKTQYEEIILTSQLEVQNSTLQYIGQELHDNIGQLLTVVRINLNNLENSTQEPDNLEYIKQANELVCKSIDDIRALSKSLDGNFVQDFGFVESINQELHRISRSGKLKAELQIVGDVFELGFKREIVLFRIIQEVLNNALKHSEAKQFIVQLNYTKTFFLLTLTDDGKGFDFDSIKSRSIISSGAGLSNIQRRANLIGGECKFDTSIGNGTKILITLNRYQLSN